MDDSVIKIIIDNKIDINQTDQDGNTLLHTLVNLNKKSDIIELLKYTPNILHKNNININSIELANKLNYIDIHQTLIDYCVQNKIDYLSNPDQLITESVNSGKDSDSSVDSTHDHDSNYSESDYQSMSSSVSSNTSELSE